MARKHQTRIQERASRALSTARDRGEGVLERMEELLSKPWDFLAGATEPRMELRETSTELVVSARLAGFKPEEISIDCTENSVTVRGEATRTSQTRERGGLHRESEERAFLRSMSLPAPVKPDEAKASFKDGRLEIRLPRAKPTQVRRVDIQGG